MLANVTVANCFTASHLLVSGCGLGRCSVIFVILMQVHKNLSFLPLFRKAVITIGTFDGVHAGHRKIIEQLKNEADKVDGETVIITFHPHPRKVVREGQSPVPILTTLDEKIELLQELQINHLVIISFDEAFANQTAEEYIRYFLVQKFHPHTIIIGYDHKFGKERAGDYHLLEEWGQKLNFVVKEIPEQILNEVIVSSTKIRSALLNSDVATANRFLSYNYFFEGTVVKGKQLGRTLGYPTANIEIEDEEKLVPGNGIYAVEVWGLGQELSTIGYQPSAISRKASQRTSLVLPQTSYLTPHTLQGMMSIGLNPTVNGTKRTIEVNIFNWDKEIYGETLRIIVKHYLRAEEKFDGLDALKENLAKDKEATLKIFNG